MHKPSRKTIWVSAILVVLVGGVVLLSRIGVSEVTFEFDTVNFRDRECQRDRSKWFGFVLREKCFKAEEHAVARRLRELGVLEPIHEEDSRWELMAGFKPGVRGWRGEGKYFIRELGEVTFGTAVTFPAKEDLEKNIWVHWAQQDPKIAKQFWANLQSFVRKGGYGSLYLRIAKTYLKENKFKIDLPAMEAFIEKEMRN
jgi:hypothetical protein